MCTMMVEEKTQLESLNKTQSEDEPIEKHPLQNAWRLWFKRPEKGNSGGNWEDSVLSVTSFSSVEDFWALYNHVELASNLPVGSDYSVFKEGIKPMWEDPKNQRGGRWLFQFLKKNNQNRVQVDEVWLEILLALIGEAFGEDSELVCGVVINIRGRMDKISIWTDQANNAEAMIKIGKVLKSRTKFKGQLNYEAHDTDENKAHSSNKISYTV